MVTDEERDYMYSEYAKDPRMKRNIGIGRRLAPLVDNDRRVAELLHSMLFSLPGSPVLYYGDEIGMGDNIYLGDRDGVRTPMQWAPDRNAGFSRADFAQLYLPPLMDPVYGYQTVNVEAQMRNPSSMLHWMRRMLEVRRQHMVFGTGSMEVVSTDNPSVLAYVRTPVEGQLPVGHGRCQRRDSRRRPGTSRDVVLCVTNLSRFAQPAQLPLQRWQGMTPVELLGRVPFPPITRTSLFHNAPSVRLLLVRVGRPATQPDWRLTMEQGTLVPEELPPLLVDLLGPYLARQRWYGGGEGPPGPVRTIESGCLAELGQPFAEAALGGRRGTRVPITRSLLPNGPSARSPST